MSVVTLLAAGILATTAGEAPAVPKFRLPPDYPASCLSGAVEGKVERVVVVYTIDRDGRVESARIRETTNSCFNEAAIAAVHSWEFTPRKVDGRSMAQEDVETTLTFMLEAPTGLIDFDARPLVRRPPRYPQKCVRSAADRETVLVEFDVTAEGTTANIRAIDASNTCLVKSAEDAVVTWKYAPKIIDGKPAPRKGVRTLVTYELSGGPAGVRADRVRAPVWNALRRVSRYLGPDGDPDKALEELAKIESKYGGDFTRAEQAAFHQLRGGARLDKKDYAGALDDWRIAWKLGAPTKDQQKLRALIAELERIVAEQQPAPQSVEPDPPAPAPDPVEQW